MEHLAYFGVKFVRFEVNGRLHINVLGAWALELNFSVQKPESLGPRHCFSYA